MAYTKANSVVTVWGNKRVETFLLTADAASGAIDTKVSVIESVFTGPVSAATAAGKFKINKNSAATALNGSLFASSIANGDDFYIMVIGR